MRWYGCPVFGWIDRGETRYETLPRISNCMPFDPDSGRNDLPFRQAIVEVPFSLGTTGHHRGAGRVL